MSYGMIINKSDTSVNLNNTLLGGRVFVQFISLAAGTATTTYTYSNIASHTSLQYYFVNAGAHEITTATVSGNATLTLTPVFKRSQFGQSTVVLVFTTQTREPDYGIAMVNDNGERLISSVYPVPEFLGKITPPTTPAYTTAASSGYTKYSHSVTNIPGLNRQRLVLWTIPEHAADVWITGSGYLAAGTNSINIEIICPTGTAYTLPEAFVFALQPAASADSYGMRIYSPTADLLFDAGSETLKIKGFVNVVYSTTQQSVTSSVFSGTLPAVLIPSLIRETATQRGAQPASDIVEYRGAVRRVGTTLYSKMIVTASYYEDFPLNYTQTYGTTNTTTITIDAQTLGAATSQALTATIIPVAGGTTVCTYDPSTLSSCSTSENFSTSYSGGNGTAVTYSWSLSSAPGFSISGSTTASTCIVTHNGSGTATYTGTLTCAVTQSGVTVYPNIALSHTHTANATNLSGSISVSSQTSTCNFTTAGGSCSTSETHTISTSGGTGATKSYAWSFTANTGGFTMSTPTTGTSVTVSRTAAAGTYTCTIQCAVTQNGTTIYVTQNVSHTHTYIPGYTLSTLSCANTATNAYAESISGTPLASAYCNVYRDGTWTITANGATQQSGTWINPTSSVIGDSYYVKFTKVTSSGLGTFTPTGTDSGWILINGTKFCGTSSTIATDGTRDAFGTYKIEFSANQSTVLSTTTGVQLNASVYRGIPQ